MYSQSTHIPSPDSTLHTHLSLLSSNTSFSTKLLYSLRCLSSSISHSNSNHYANLLFLSEHKEKLLNLVQNNKSYEYQFIEIFVNLMNGILSMGNCLKQDEELLIVQAVIQMEWQPQQYLSDNLANEIIELTNKLKYSDEFMLPLLNAITPRMTPSQTVSLMENFKNKDIYKCSTNQLLEIAQKNIKNDNVIWTLLDAVYWQAINKDVKLSQFVDFISKNLYQIISYEKLKYYISLIYREAKKNSGSNKENSVIDRIFTNQISDKEKQFFILRDQNFVKQFKDIELVLNRKESIKENSSFQIIIQFYAKQKFPFRSLLIESFQKDNSNTLKEFLLRSTEKFDQTSTRKTKMQITSVQECDFSSFLPIECLRTCQGLLQKIKKLDHPSQALQIIKNLNFLDRSNESYPFILLRIHEIYLMNKNFSSLKQIEKIIEEQYSSDFVIKKLKEKGTIKNIDSNKDSKRFFIWLPLFTTKSEIEANLSDQICSIFLHETIPIQCKTYVANFLLNKMIYRPFKKFVQYLMRQLQNNVNKQIYTEILYYLKKNLQKLPTNNVHIEWIKENFSEQLERLNQNIFSRISVTKLVEIRQIIFQLEKYGIFKDIWLHTYKWSLNSLQFVNADDQQYTLDCLQIFEMIVEKIQPGNISKNIVEKFQKCIMINWGKYNYQHLFAIERIVEILKEHSKLAFSQIKNISLNQVVKQQQKFDKEHQFYQEQLFIHPSSKYIANIIYNAFFGFMDTQQAIDSIFRIYNQYGENTNNGAITEKNIINTINFIMWLYSTSDEDPPSNIDSFIVSLLETNTNSKKYGILVMSQIHLKCLEYLAVIPHKINFLKLELNKLLNLNFNSPKALQNLTEIINIITQEKPQAISKFKFHHLLENLMINLIFVENSDYEEELVLFLEANCFVEGEYSKIIEENIFILKKILNIEIYGIGYRTGLIEFVIDTLMHYQEDIQDSTVWFLLRKYCEQEKIVLNLLSFCGKISSSIPDNRFLKRLLRIHNENQQVQENIKTIFNTTTPKTSFTQQFNKQLRNGDYLKCENLIQKVQNPYQLKISGSDVKQIIQRKDCMANCKKLMRFLLQTPETKKLLFSCEQFLIQEQFLPFLQQILKNSNEQLLIKKFIVSKDQKGVLVNQQKPQFKLLYETFKKTILNKNLSTKFHILMKNLSLKQVDKYESLLNFLATIFKFNIFAEQNYQTVTLLYGFLKKHQDELSTQSAKDNFDRILYIFPQIVAQIQRYNFLQESYEDKSSIQLVSLMDHVRCIFSKYHSLPMKDQEKNEYVCRVWLYVIKNYLKFSSEENLQMVLNMFLLLSEKNNFFYSSINKSFSQNSFESLNYEVENWIIKILSENQRDGSYKPKKEVIFGFISYCLFADSSQLINQHIFINNVLQNFITKHDNLSQEQLQIVKQSCQWLINRNSLKSKEKQKVKKINQGDIISPVKVSQKFQKMKQEKQDHQQNQKKEAEEAYIRFREVEQNITQVQTEIIHKKTYILLEENAEGQIFQQKMTSPKLNLEKLQETFYHDPVQTPKRNLITSQQRNENLKLIQNAENNEISIHSLKDHNRYIIFLSQIQRLTETEFKQLFKSIQSISETVLTHQYYCKKLVDMETLHKLVIIYKKMTQYDEKVAEELAEKILLLCKSISEKKEKKLLFFSQDYIQLFFKQLVKKALNSNNKSGYCSSIISIMGNCKNTVDYFYKSGLISMIIELINRSFLVQQVIQYFIKIELNIQIINEIYQRGLFKKMIQSFQSNAQIQGNLSVMNLWIKLSGKVCVNGNIQKKFINSNLHKLLHQKLQYFKQKQDLLNICYFYAYISLKNQQVCQYLIENKIIQHLLGLLKNQNNIDDLYLMFYHFMFGNTISRDYCIRIKYHLHLIDKINEKYKEIQEEKERLVLNKYFFKSLGQIMTNKVNQQLFFKEQIVKKLVHIYENKQQASIYQCFLDFIEILETDNEFDELKKQNFWECLKIFEYKISNEAAYSYILQIFLVMIKKNRIVEFNKQQIRGKTTLKAQFSTNMEGKELCLRFIIALSIKNKENYLTQRCVRLLNSIMGLKVGKNQLVLLHNMLTIEKSLKTHEFMKFFVEYDICNLLCDNFQKLSDDQSNICLENMQLLSHHPSNSFEICSKLLTKILNLIKETKDKHKLKLLWKLLSKLAEQKKNMDLFEAMEVSFFLQKEETLIKCKQFDCSTQYSQTIQNMARNGTLEEQEMTSLNRISAKHQVILNIENAELKQVTRQQKQQSLQIMQKGLIVKMYKTDGSISQLLLFMSNDRLELNCVAKPGQSVKNKWRLPLNQVKQIIKYPGQQSTQYLNSYFEKNSGIFNKTPPFDNCLTLQGKDKDFHICYGTSVERNAWEVHINIAIENTKKILSKLQHSVK